MNELYEFSSLLQIENDNRISLRFPKIGVGYAYMEKDTKNKEQIEKLPNSKVRRVNRLKNEGTILEVEGLINAIEATGLQEFMEYIRSPWKMLWPNFVAGIARGFGALVGATIVIAIVGWFLSTLIDIPLIGKQMEPYIQQVQSAFTQFTETNNYRSNFEHMQKTLESIDSSLKQQGN